MIEAIDFAHKAILPVIEAQDRLMRMVGVNKDPAPEVSVDETLVEAVARTASQEMRAVMTTPGKMLRRDRKKALKERVEALEAASSRGQVEGGGGPSS